jgi:hypothetical protein
MLYPNFVSSLMALSKLQILPDYFILLRTRQSSGYIYCILELYSRNIQCSHETHLAGL